MLRPRRSTARRCTSGGVCHQQLCRFGECLESVHRCVHLAALLHRRLRARRGDRLFRRRRRGGRRQQHRAAVSKDGGHRGLPTPAQARSGVPPPSQAACCMKATWQATSTRSQRIHIDAHLSDRQCGERVPACGRADQRVGMSQGLHRPGRQLPVRQHRLAADIGTLGMSAPHLATFARIVAAWGQSEVKSGAEMNNRSSRIILAALVTTAAIAGVSVFALVATRSTPARPNWHVGYAASKPDRTRAHLLAGRQLRWRA